MPRILTPAIPAALLAALASALVAANPAFAASPPAPEAYRTAMSALGDLSPYRSIAADTLAIVDKGDIAAARSRIKDLETAWDQGEASLKPKDNAAWRKLDVMIDAVLADLRTPMAKASDCAASLKALIKTMDSLQTADIGFGRRTLS